MLFPRLYYSVYRRFVYWYHYRIRKNKNPLKDLLIKNNQTRWLDLGSGVKFKEGFLFADIVEEDAVPENMTGKYFKLDVSKPLTGEDLNKTGKFDLIRMQHVFEHFTVEDGLVVLDNCYNLLNPGGYLLITVPDLEVYANFYTGKVPTDLWGFQGLAEQRFPLDAPPSFYFSIYAHLTLDSKHLWCYDKDGLFYQLGRSGKFSNIEKIGFFHRFCNLGFTHNRPFLEVCVLASKK
jgi:SAM-dependent methyltransferase